MLIIAQVLDKNGLKVTVFAHSQTTNKLVNEAANDSARVSGQGNKIPCPQEKSEEPSPIFPKLKTKLFAELKESKAALGIPNKLIKIAAQQLAKPFAYIFNECIFIGVVPDVVKLSQVTPVHSVFIRMAQPLTLPTTDQLRYYHPSVRLLKN